MGSSVARNEKMSANPRILLGGKTRRLKPDREDMKKGNIIVHFAFLMDKPKYAILVTADEPVGITGLR